MRKELTILTKVTKEVTGSLPGGETVRYSGAYEPARGLAPYMPPSRERAGRYLPSTTNARGRSVIISPRGMISRPWRPS